MNFCSAGIRAPLERIRAASRKVIDPALRGVARILQHRQKVLPFRRALRLVDGMRKIWNVWVQFPLFVTCDLLTNHRDFSGPVFVAESKTTGIVGCPRTTTQLFSILHWTLNTPRTPLVSWSHRSYRLIAAFHRLHSRSWEKFPALLEIFRFLRFRLQKLTTSPQTFLGINKPPYILVNSVLGHFLR